MNLINETNVATGTYYKVLETANLKNIAFQYKLITGVDNTIELQFWVTVDNDADNSTDDDWVNTTSFFCDDEKVVSTNGSVHDMSLLDSNITLAKIKIKYIITTTTPNNTIKVGWNSDK